MYDMSRNLPLLILANLKQAAYFVQICRGMVIRNEELNVKLVHTTTTSR
jgi:hypothetical protein